MCQQSTPKNHTRNKTSWEIGFLALFNCIWHRQMKPFQNAMMFFCGYHTELRLLIWRCEKKKCNRELYFHTNLNCSEVNQPRAESLFNKEKKNQFEFAFANSFRWMKDWRNHCYVTLLLLNDDFWSPTQLVKMLQCYSPYSTQSHLLEDYLPQSSLFGYSSEIHSLEWTVPQN